MQVKKKRNLIFANVFLLLVLAAGATYAWFAINTSANVTLSEVEVKGPGELLMKLTSPIETEWTTNLVLKENDFAKLKMVDVSGKGNGTFYRPKAVDGNGNPGDGTDWLNVSVGQEGGTATTNHNGANVDYMQISVDFKAQSDNNPDSIDLILKAGSKISTVAPTAKLQNEDPDLIENKSTFGNFSKDYVVGGIRVSAMPDSGVSTDNPIFLWIPEPNVELKVDGEGENKTYSILTNPETDQPKHTYVNSISNSGNPKYSTVDFTGEKLISGQITSGASGTEKPIVTLTDTNSDGYYTGSATFYVWLEGCDTEARRALVGGRFRLQLLLDTVEKKLS